MQIKHNHQERKIVDEEEISWIFTDRGGEIILNADADVTAFSQRNTRYAFSSFNQYISYVLKNAFFNFEIHLLLFNNICYKKVDCFIFSRGHIWLAVVPLC